jgi:hypothetical protein
MLYSDTRREILMVKDPVCGMMVKKEKEVDEC